MYVCIKCVCLYISFWMVLQWHMGRRIENNQDHNLCQRKVESAKNGQTARFQRPLKHALR